MHEWRRGFSDLMACTAEALGEAGPSWASFCLSLQCSAANLCSV